jgi:hypothetical protein
MALLIRNMPAAPDPDADVLLLMLAPVYVRDLLAGQAADLALAFGVVAGTVVAMGLFALRGLRSAENAA